MQYWILVLPVFQSNSLFTPPLDSLHSSPLAWPGLWRRPLRVEELLMTVNNNYCWCIITEPLSCAEESKNIRRKLRSTLRMTMKRWWVTILIQNPALSDHQASERCKYSNYSWVARSSVWQYGLSSFESVLGKTRVETELEIYRN